MWENGMPPCNGASNTPCGLSLPIGCAPIAGEGAVVNGTNWQVTPRDSLTLRNKFMDDESGQCTGTMRYHASA